MKAATGQPNSRLSSTSFVFIFCIFLFVLAWVAYLNTVRYPFVHDDVVFIVHNPAIKELTHFSTIFIPEADPTRPLAVNAYYRPLLEILYRIQYQFFGFNPAGYHAFNILLHGLNAILVFLLSLKVLRREGLAAGVALLFLLHPVHTETVACVAGVSNLVFAFWGLVCLLFLKLCQETESAGRKLIHYALALGSFALSLLAKEQAVIWVPLAFLLCWLADDSRQKFSNFLRFSGFLVVLAGYLTWRSLVVDSPLGQGWVWDEEARLRLLSIPRQYLLFVELLILPVNYHYYRNLDILAPWQGASVVFTCVLLGVWLLARRFPETQRRLVWIGTGWFLCSLLPTLNIVPLVNEYSLILTAEHFVYVGSIGFLWALATLVQGYWFKEENMTPVSLTAEFRKALALKWAVGGLAAVFFVLTVAQTTYWRSEVALFERTVQHQPQFARGRILLGKAYYFDRQYAAAIEQYAIARESMSRYFQSARDPRSKDFYRGFLKGIYFDVAHCYEALGRWPDALAAYRAASELDPGDAALFNNLAVVCLRLGDRAQAEHYFATAYALNPRDSKTATNWAVFLMQAGKVKEGLSLLRRVVESGERLDPSLRQWEAYLQAPTE